jgi:hypothetical protein
MKHVKFFENYIGESLLSSVKIDSILSPETVKSVLDLGDHYLDLYREENYLDEEEEIDEEDFKNWLKYELMWKTEDLIRFYESEIIKGGKLTIWRAMTVKDDYILHLEKEAKHLGIYWTWDPDSAETHWGDYSKKSKALIEAEISENGVDWEKTLISNIQPYIGDDEKEITLSKGSPMKIISLEIDGKIKDISKIAGKTFYA